MKTIMNKITASLFILALLFVASCKKGDTGPAGEPGKDGSSNVTATTYSIGSWTNGSSFWYADLTVPALTASNHDLAAVQVFFSTNNGTNWIALPYTAVSSTNYFMEYVTGVNLVEVQWIYNGVGNGSSPNSFYGTTIYIKVVVIPPGMKKPGINTNNYHELKAAYNLKD